MLQRLQNSALRIILNEGRLTPTDTMHKTLNIINLDTRRKHHICHQMYKGVNNLSPAYICSKLETIDRRDGMRTRTAGKGHIKSKRVTLQTCKKNFFHKGPNIWNPLEYEIKTCDNLQAFKNQLYSSKAIL